MPRTAKSIMQEPEVQKAIELAKNRRAKGKITEAKSILKEFESEYEHAKEVFFKVNGARRIIKNLNKESDESPETTTE